MTGSLRSHFSPYLLPKIPPMCHPHLGKGKRPRCVRAMGRRRHALASTTNLKGPKVTSHGILSHLMKILHQLERFTDTKKKRNKFGSTTLVSSIIYNLYRILSNDYSTIWIHFLPPKKNMATWIATGTFEATFLHAFTILRNENGKTEGVCNSWW